MKLKNSLLPAAVMLSATSFAQTTMDERYDTWPVYSGDDLELAVDNAGTHFTLWSPEADAVSVQIYDTDRNTAPVQTISMTRADNGTWHANVPEKLYGKFYTFTVTAGTYWRRMRSWARKYILQEREGVMLQIIVTQRNYFRP